MADINAQQIRKIYAIGNALGIVERGNEDDDLHALVSALTGKDSVKALTYTGDRRPAEAAGSGPAAQAQTQDPPGAPRRGHRRPAAQGVGAHVSAGQGG